MKKNNKRNRRGVWGLKQAQERHSWGKLMLFISCFDTCLPLVSKMGRKKMRKRWVQFFKELLNTSLLIDKTVSNYCHSFVSLLIFLSCKGEMVHHTHAYTHISHFSFPHNIHISNILLISSSPLYYYISIIVGVGVSLIEGSFGKWAFSL